MIENIDINFKEIIDNIKKDIIGTRNKIMYSANTELIHMYFRLGKVISDNTKYGNKFIAMLATSLKIDFPNATGFSERNLRRMKAFYEQYMDMPNLPLAVANLPWTHNYLLIEKIKDREERIWYAEECLENGWSKTVLIHQIELNLYERKKIANKFTNFKDRFLIKEQSNLANEIIKDPYIFEIEGIKKDCDEKELENAMISKIKEVLLELGKGFSFVGNQYRISTDNNDYFIDLLFYHLDLRCYIVVELKVTEFKPEYAGQISFYVKAVDKTLRKKFDNPTIGLLLCKEKDKLSVEWALETINVPIGISSFELEKYIPKNILEKLPTEEELNLHIDLENKNKDNK